jgi:hypothetical protein
MKSTTNGGAGGAAAINWGKKSGHQSRNPSCAGHDSRDMEKGVKKLAGTSHNGRRSVFERLTFNHHITPHVQLDEEGPRPTRKFKFKWKPSTKTLRITKLERGKRASEWV